MNKKLITALVVVAAVLALSFCLAACGDDGTQPGGGDGGDGGDGGIAHTISVDAPDDVEVTTSATSASAGITITVTVVTPAWKIVTSVTAADVTIVKDEAASAGSTSVYTFTMPDRDVEVTVETTDSGASVDEDDGLKWVAAPKQIAPGEYSSATYEVDFGGSVIASTDGDGNLSGVKISSTDQDVIPDEAIDGAHRIGDSASTGGAKFTVDLTKVSLGATTLVFEDSRGRTIAKYVQVVEYGTVVPGEVVNTTLEVKYDKFDEGKLDLDDGIDPKKLVVLVSVTDVDRVDGTDPDTGAEEYAQQRFLLSNKGSKTFAIGYIKGHRYRVSVTLYSYTNDYETDGYPEFSEVYGNELMLYDYMAGMGNSVIKDEDGKSWLKIDNASSTVTLTVNVK